jgi:hypothetical protein
VAGLREHYTAEQLVGQRVPVLVNLKAATLQGVKSHGMVLVAAPANRPFLLLSCADQPVGTPVVPAVRRPPVLSLPVFLLASLCSSLSHARAV